MWDFKNVETGKGKVESYPYRWRSARTLAHRFNQPCQIIELDGLKAVVKFEDGYTAHVDRMNVRLPKEPKAQHAH